MKLNRFGRWHFVFSEMDLMELDERGDERLWL